MAPVYTPPSRLPAGIAPVDAAWGGLLRGGTYLLVGSAAGRGRLALAALRGSAGADALGLLVSPRTPAALLAAAEADGFDLGAAYRRRRAKLIGAPAPSALAGLDDDGLARALGDLAALLPHHRPDRLVVEDFSAFVRFSTFEAFAAAFRALAEAAASASATLVLGLGEPANASSSRLLLFLQGETAGTLHVTTGPGGDAQLALLPGTAHVGEARTVALTEDVFTGIASTEKPLADAVPEDVAPTPPEPGASPVDDEHEAPEGEASAAQAPRASTLDLIDFEVDEDLEDEATAAEGPPEGSNVEEPLAEDPFAYDPFAADEHAPAGADGCTAPAELALDPPDLFVAPARPSDDADWTAITPVDPTEVPLEVYSPRDPFGVDLGPDLLTLGHFVDSQRHGAPAPSGDGLTGDGLADATASVQQAAYPELFAGAPPSDVAPAADPEVAFRRALARALAGRAGTPFLVLALRLDPAGPYADLLPAVAHGLDAALGDDGALFGHPERGRLVALLPGFGSESASGLFAAVRAHLYAVAPDRAAEALRAVGALAVPNGEPFASADDLLAYVMA